MKLVQCKNLECRRIQLAAEHCRYCEMSALEPIGTIGVHERMIAGYEYACALISNSDFHGALAMLNQVKQWSPKEPGVYYYRMMAKFECTTESELLAHGFDCREEHGDIDFYLARKFAKEFQMKNESEFFARMETVENKIQQALEAAEREAFEKELLAKRNEMLHFKSELEAMQDSLFQKQKEKLVLELEKSNLHSQLRSLCYAKENTSLKDAAAKVKDIGEEIESLDKATLESDMVHTYYVDIFAAMRKAVEAGDQLERCRSQHPWQWEIQMLSKKQAALDAEIAEMQEALLTLREEVSELMEAYSSLEADYAEVMDAIASYRFLDGLHYTSEKAYLQIVRTASGIQERWLSLPKRTDA